MDFENLILLDPKKQKQNSQLVIQYEQDAIVAAMDVINNGASRMEDIQSLMDAAFPYQLGELQQAEEDFDKQLGEDGGYWAANKLLEDVMPKYRDALGVMLSDWLVLEEWLLLTLDRNAAHKDGPAYGAQADLLGEIRSSCTKLQAGMDSVLAYHEHQVTTKVQTETIQVTTNCEANPASSLSSEIVVGESPSVSVRQPLQPAPVVEDVAGGVNNNVVTVEKERTCKKGSVAELMWYNGRQAHLTNDVAMYSKMLLSLKRHQTDYKTILQRTIRIQHIMHSPERGAVLILYCLRSTFGCLCNR